jgi:transcriptional regulator with XRE-family HTH domain
MIKNERQYRITAAEIERFAKALSGFEAKPPTESDIHPVMWAAERQALESQLQELRDEAQAYEALKAGERRAFPIRTWEDVPRALIEGRIAARLTQKDLADRLSIPEQQVQRYEATDYSSASLARIQNVAEAIGLQLEGLVHPPGDPSPKQLVRRIKDLGLDAPWALNRLFPAEVAAAIQGTYGRGKSSLTAEFLRAASIVERVFQVPMASLFETAPLSLNPAVIGQTQFKRPGRRTKESTAGGAYTFYAHYIALLLLQATKHLPKRSRPTSPLEWRIAIIESHGSFNFENALRFVWSCGIPVLPLRDPGVFHGACWRTNDGDVLVLKQRTKSEDKWLFDLLHEIGHLVPDRSSKPQSVVEAATPEPTDPDEVFAMEFAGEVILAGRAGELAELAVKEANGLVERLKSVVPRIAQRADVSTGALANYLAFRIAKDSEGKISWWGTANALQREDQEPWRVARDVLLEHVDFTALSNEDRDLLTRALSAIDEDIAA